MVSVILSIDGHTVLVDEEDVDIVQSAPNLRIWQRRLEDKTYTDCVFSVNQRTKSVAYLMYPDAVRIKFRNNDRLDIRRINLSVITMSQLNASFKRRKVSQTGFRGVQPVGRGFAAYVGSRKNKNSYLGTFATARDAAIAYNAEAVRRWGEHAVLNNVHGKGRRGKVG